MSENKSIIVKNRTGEGWGKGFKKNSNASFESYEREIESSNQKQRKYPPYCPIWRK